MLETIWRLSCPRSSPTPHLVFIDAFTLPWCRRLVAVAYHNGVVGRVPFEFLVCFEQPFIVILVLVVDGVVRFQVYVIYINGLFGSHINIGLFDGCWVEFVGVDIDWFIAFKVAQRPSFSVCTRRLGHHISFPL